ncbi:CPBP family intramembrane glutamic endopeptidase [Hasllibacter sp. MH4015]|uniref:CPBP family intramembrane glutamic endopeptidase n=1 Tax=Hasllibacter sp. MH4015 TaxID=2854029 RepID=UPI001CD5AE9D|nr:CPBP family intramembrane glutamic endopeptidase [Hasllibacter sp. MH4015]
MLKQIHAFADRHALALALVIVLGYFAYFFIPGALSSNSFGRGETHSDVASMSAQLTGELLLAASILALIVVLGWTKSARLTTPLRHRSLWWLLPPLLFTSLILLVGLSVTGPEGQGPGPAVAGIVALLATVALIGIFEELLFRGLLFRGIEAKAGPLSALVGSSIIFGLMHYVNWVGGQPFGDTTVQVIHAAAGGFMYGAIMLMTGSIWPGVFLHAFWDGTVSVVSTIREAAAPELNTETSTLSSVENLPTEPAGGGIAELLFAGFEPVYGLIVMLAWLALRHRRTAATRMP